jgi:hypothetical protein
MGGLGALSDWLHCRLFLTDFRPVPLTEHAVFEGVVFRKVRIFSHCLPQAALTCAAPLHGIPCRQPQTPCLACKCMHLIVETACLVLGSDSTGVKEIVSIG